MSSATKKRPINGLKWNGNKLSRPTSRWSYVSDTGWNRRGALATIAAVISATDTNIETINTSERDGNTTTMYLLLNVRDRAPRPRDAPVAHLARNLEMARRG